MQLSSVIVSALRASSRRRRRRWRIAWRSARGEAPQRESFQRVRLRPVHLHQNVGRHMSEMHYTRPNRGRLFVLVQYHIHDPPPSSVSTLKVTITSTSFENSIVLSNPSFLFPFPFCSATTRRPLLDNLVQRRTHIVRKIPADDANGVLTEPESYGKCLRGALVHVVFGLSHYAYQSRGESAFVPSIREITVVRPPPVILTPIKRGFTEDPP